MISVEMQYSSPRAAAVSRILASLLFVFTLIFASAGHAEVLWRGDFETGNLEQWPGAPKSAGLKIVQDPVRQGKFAVRIDGTNADRKGKFDRLELQHQSKPPGTAEGTERYFG